MTMDMISLLILITFLETHSEDVPADLMAGVSDPFQPLTTRLGEMGTPFVGHAQVISML